MAKLEMEIDFEKLGEELAKHDFVEVVRCKECKRFAEFTSNGKTMGFGSCNNPQNSMSKCPQIDWFCADGVRKEKEDDK